MNAKAPMMILDLPDDQAWLAAWAKVSLRHSHLDHSLRMLVKTLTDVTIEEALDATAYEASSSLRTRCRKLGRQRLGEGQALVRTEALLERAARLTDARNGLVHGLVATPQDSAEALMRRHDHQWENLPTREALEQLATQLASLASEINTARLRGFLFDALQRR
jgi:hypothetical protein